MRRFIKAIKYFLRKVSASRVNAYSAQTAYFMFLSLIPLIMMLFSLLQIFGDAGETLTDTISKILPGILGEFINEYVSQMQLLKSSTDVIAFILYTSLKKFVIVYHIFPHIAMVRRNFLLIIIDYFTTHTSHYFRWED